MEAPDKVDYPTDGDSDDNAGFSIKVNFISIDILQIPELAELMNEFEKDDEVVYQRSEKQKQYFQELKVKGVERQPREEIQDSRKERASEFDKNISVQREEQSTRLMGMVEDINEVIKAPKNKIYLR